MATESSTNREHFRLYNKALSLWDSRVSHRLLAQDSHLTDDKQSPDKKWGTDTLRNWIMTRRLAIAAAREAALARNDTLDSWICANQPNVNPS